MKIDCGANELNSSCQAGINISQRSMPDGLLGIGEVCLQASRLKSIEHMVRDIIASEEPAFATKVDRYGNVRNMPLRLSRHFDRTWSAIDIYYALQESERNISPYVALFFEEYLKQCGPYVTPYLQMNWDADSVNALIERIRTRSRTPSFQRRIKAYGGLDIAMYYRLITYVRCLLIKYEALLVLRIDLHLPMQEDMTSTQAKSHLKHFLDNRRNKPSLFEHNVGYIWKLEHGDDRKYHFHCIFFLDGAKVMDDGIRLAEAYGRYWESLFPYGDAGFHNSNREKDEKRRKGVYRFDWNGIGRIHRSDLDKRQNLYRAIAYIAKQDQSIPMRMKHERDWACGAIGRLLAV